MALSRAHTSAEAKQSYTVRLAPIIEKEKRKRMWSDNLHQIPHSYLNAVNLCDLCNSSEEIVEKCCEVCEEKTNVIGPLTGSEPISFPGPCPIRLNGNWYFLWWQIKKQKHGWGNLFIGAITLSVTLQVTLSGSWWRGLGWRCEP